MCAHHQWFWNRRWWPHYHQRHKSNASRTIGDTPYEPAVMRGAGVVHVSSFTNMGSKKSIWVSLFLSTILPYTCVKHRIYSNVDHVVYYNIMRVGHLHSPQHQYLCIECVPLVELKEVFRIDMVHHFFIMIKNISGGITTEKPLYSRLQVSIM